MEPLTTAVTLVTIIAIAMGIGLLWFSLSSFGVWIWTFSRPTDEKPFEWSKGRYYRGEMSPTLVMASTEGDGIWKTETSPPHEMLHERAEVLGGIRTDLTHFAVSVVLTVTGVFLFHTWGRTPGVGMGVFFGLGGFIIWLKLRVFVAYHDIPYPTSTPLLGASRGGLLLGWFGVATATFAALS